MGQPRGVGGGSRAWKPRGSRDQNEHVEARYKAHFSLDALLGHLSVQAHTLPQPPPWDAPGSQSERIVPVELIRFGT